MYVVSSYEQLASEVVWMAFYPDMNHWFLFLFKNLLVSWFGDIFPPESHCSFLLGNDKQLELIVVFFSPPMVEYQLVYKKSDITGS